MNQRIAITGVLLTIGIVSAGGLIVHGQQPSDSAGSADAAKAEKPKSEDSAPKSKFTDFETLVKDAEKFEGLLRLYRKEEKLYAEVPPDQFEKNFIVLISIARGIGRYPLLGGSMWGFGDEWVWSFRRVGDNLHVVRRNLRFRAAPGQPAADAVGYAFTDSVVASLKIESISPRGAPVVDVTPVFMSDLPDLARHLGPGFRFDASRSTWAKNKVFEKNVEIEVAAVYSSSQYREMETVPDPRGAQVYVHYSISQLPQNNYRPRLADDRIGYFVTAIKDYSRDTDDTRFVRYINRWHLEKADPSADTAKGQLSPPKEPIIFYIEKAVPYRWRRYIREGILEWNKAFEKIGFVNAIEVRDQQEEDEFDPEDIRYNTFRWMTASAGFARGPSRVNPLTGQILDADITFDADFILYWKQEYEGFTPLDVATVGGMVPDAPLELFSLWDWGRRPDRGRTGWPLEQVAESDDAGGRFRSCHYGAGLSPELGLVATALLAQGQVGPGEELPEEFIGQGLKHVTSHEVGHTLGLRHNFKGSSWLSLEELNDSREARREATIASVMDYSPANVVSKEKEQGMYFSPTVGPYDYWAIEYGYKSIEAPDPESEKNQLEEIADRVAEAGHAFATDEDTRSGDPDPLANRWDLGSDPLDFAQQRTRLISELWPGTVDRVVGEGKGYQRARQAFNLLLGRYGQAAYIASRFVGGVYMHRDHKGDPDGQPPFVIAEPGKQREALELTVQSVFSDRPFQFPPELLNRLDSSRWAHWGTELPERIDYPLHESILMWQQRVLSQLFSPTTLTRIQDNEPKVPVEQDAFTLPELFNTLSTAIWSELDAPEQPEEYTNRRPFTSGLRRNLQRAYLKVLIDLLLHSSPGTPEDARTLAWRELDRLQGRIAEVLDREGLELDGYSQAHLSESRERIRKALDAHFQMSPPRS